MEGRNFLCDSSAERARLLDINSRLLRVEQLGILLFTLAMLAGIPSFGYAPLIPVGLGAAAFYFVQPRLHRYERP